MFAGEIIIFLPFWCFFTIFQLTLRESNMAIGCAWWVFQPATFEYRKLYPLNLNNYSIKSACLFFLVTNPLKDDKSIQRFFWFFGLSENTQKSGGDSWWILIFPQKTHHFSGYTQLSTTQFGTLYPHQRSLRQLSGCPPPKPKKLLRAMPMLAQHPDWPWGGRVYPTRLSMVFPQEVSLQMVNITYLIDLWCSDATWCRRFFVQ